MGWSYFTQPVQGTRERLSQSLWDEDPLDGAEVVVRLVCEGRDGGTFGEFEGGEMRILPW